MYMHMYVWFTVQTHDNPSIDKVHVANKSGATKPWLVYEGGGIGSLCVCHRCECNQRQLIFFRVTYLMCLHFALSL